MTKLLCPLCGEDVRAVRSYGNTPVWRAGCFNCMWSTALLFSTKKDSLEAAAELIAKFPPIMRVQAGDRLMIYSCDDEYNVRVESVKREEDKSIRLIAKFIDDGINDECEDVSEWQIVKWPWEILNGKKESI